MAGAAIDDGDPREAGIDEGLAEHPAVAEREEAGEAAGAPLAVDGACRARVAHELAHAAGESALGVQRHEEAHLARGGVVAPQHPAAGLVGALELEEAVDAPLLGDDAQVGEGVGDSRAGGACEELDAAHEAGARGELGRPRELDGGDGAGLGDDRGLVAAHGEADGVSALEAPPARHGMELGEVAAVVAVAANGIVAERGAELAAPDQQEVVGAEAVVERAATDLGDNGHGDEAVGEPNAPSPSAERHDPGRGRDAGVGRPGTRGRRHGAADAHKHAERGR